METNAVPVLRYLLVIDADPGVRHTIEDALARDPEVTVAAYARADEAVKAASVLQPQLVLLSADGSEMDLATTITMLRSVCPADEVPVVFLTDRVRPEDIPTFKSLGVLDVIDKPVDAVVLPRMVQNIWEYYRMRVAQQVRV